MSKIAKELKKLKIKVKENYNIKNLTSFKIGGKVDLFIKAENIWQLNEIIKILKKYGKKRIILGNMTNVLINDKRLKLAIIVLSGVFRNIFIKEKNILYVGAGAKISELIAFSIKNNIGGLEFMAGIPGTLGGAVFMNAGAFGKYIGNLIKKVDVLTPEGKTKIIINNGKIFGYRNSIFQKNKNIILGMDIFYKKEKRNLIKKQVKKILKLREKKHPYNYPSAGSFFKNLKEKAAGDLIEKAGLKGLRIGKAEVSQKHANFIINKDGAKFFDVLKIAKIIKREIYKRYKIKLKEEVKIIK